MNVSQQVTHTGGDQTPTVTVSFRQGPGGERWSSAESPVWPDWVMAAVAAARARVTAAREVSR